jgi:heme oxygenase (biliverdin-producing, ferredoxin)
MSVALASQLREGTKKAHTMAENTGFVSCFLKGVVDKASYRTLVADLYFVYAAMEEEIGKLRAAGHPVVGSRGLPRTEPPREPGARSRLLFR